MRELERRDDLGLANEGQCWEMVSNLGCLNNGILLHWTTLAALPMLGSAISGAFRTHLKTQGSVFMWHQTSNKLSDTFACLVKDNRTTSLKTIMSFFFVLFGVNSKPCNHNRQWSRGRSLSSKFFSCNFKLELWT